MTISHYDFKQMVQTRYVGTNKEIAYGMLKPNSETGLCVYVETWVNGEIEKREYIKQ